MKKLYVSLLLVFLVLPLAAQNKIKNVSKAVAATTKTTSQLVNVGASSLLEKAEYQLFCTRVSALRARMNATGNSIVKMQYSDPSPDEPLTTLSVKNLGMIQASQLLEEALKKPVTSKKQEDAINALTESLQQAERRMKQMMLSYLRTKKEYDDLFQVAVEQLNNFAALGEKIYLKRQNAYSQMTRGVFEQLPVEQELLPVNIYMKGPEGERILAAENVRTLEYLTSLASDDELAWITTFEELSLEDFAVYAYLRQRLDESYDAWLQNEDDVILLQRGEYSLMFQPQNKVAKEAISDAMEEQLESVLLDARKTQADLLELVGFIVKHPAAFAPLIKSLDVTSSSDTPLVRNVSKMISSRKF